MEKEKKDILSIKDFANEISVHPNSVRNMIKTGRLNAFKIGGGKTSSYRIARSEINRLSLINLENIVDDIVEKRLNDILHKGE